MNREQGLILNKYENGIFFKFLLFTFQIITKDNRIEEPNAYTVVLITFIELPLKFLIKMKLKSTYITV